MSERQNTLYCSLVDQMQDMCDCAEMADEIRRLDEVKAEIARLVAEAERVGAELRGTMSYKLCKECGQPMLKKGQRRKQPDDYRHARGCPSASKAEQKATEALWKRGGE